MSKQEETKTPEDYAEQEMNRAIGKQIARRLTKIKQLQEQIKQLKSGEMTPREGEHSPCCSDDLGSDFDKHLRLMRDIVGAPIETRYKSKWYLM
jgi:hypothetical protein